MKIILISYFVLVASNMHINAQSKIGGNKDNHGCISAAGYQWSTLTSNCIRAFEIKIQLSNISRTFNCGIIFSEDKTKAEIFSKEGNFIMLSQNKKNDFYLSKNGWVLEKNKNRWMIKSKNKKIIYQ